MVDNFYQVCLYALLIAITLTGIAEVIVLINNSKGGGRDERSNGNHYGADNNN